MNRTLERWRINVQRTGIMASLCELEGFWCFGNATKLGLFEYRLGLSEPTSRPILETDKVGNSRFVEPLVLGSVRACTELRFPVAFLCSGAHTCPNTDDSVCCWFLRGVISSTVVLDRSLRRCCGVGLFFAILNPYSHFFDDSCAFFGRFGRPQTRTTGVFDTSDRCYLISTFLTTRSVLRWHSNGFPWFFLCVCE